MDRSLLSRATESTDAPTPGYLYVDIAKNAASSPSACTDIAQYLTRRLSTKQNHNVKYKCLKVIAKTALSPSTRGLFKRCICQDPSMVSAIKEALQFRGPPDPARGDEIYERVRTAARETLDAIYSDTPQQQQQSTSQSGFGGGGNMMGSAASASYASSPYASSGGGGGGAGSGARKMEGIGNPMYKDPRLEQPQPGGNMTVGNIMKEAGETLVGMIKDPLARHVGVANSNVPQYANSGSVSTMTYIY